MRESRVLFRPANALALDGSVGGATNCDKWGANKICGVEAESMWTERRSWAVARKGHMYELVK